MLNKNQIKNATPRSGKVGSCKGGNHQSNCNKIKEQKQIESGGTYGKS